MKKATSLQSSFSHNSEANIIKTLDPCKPKPLNTAQGLRTLNAAAKTVNLGFFVSFFQFLIGRDGAVQYKSGLSVKTARLSFEVLNVPIALRGNYLRKQNGAHSHA